MVFYSDQSKKSGARATRPQTVSDIQAGLTNIVSANGVDGTSYITHYDQQGRVDATIYGGSVTQYAYFPGENEVVPAGSRSWADPNGATAAGLRQWMIEHPGLPLNLDDRALLSIAQYLKPLSHFPQGPCDAIYVSEAASKSATKVFPEIAVENIEKVFKSLDNYWSCGNK